jgi:hypothetical protein
VELADRILHLYTGISTSTLPSPLDLPLFCGEVATDCLLRHRVWVAGLAEGQLGGQLSVHTLRVLGETSAGGICSVFTLCLLSICEGIK